MSRQAFDGTVEITKAMIGSMSESQVNLFASEPEDLISTIQAIYDKLDSLGDKSGGNLDGVTVL